MRASWLVTPLVSLLASSAQAADIKGIAIGMMDHDFIALQPYARCHGEPPDFCQYEDTVGGVAGDFFIQFEDDAVVSVVVTKIDASRFDDVRQALFKKFGKPVQAQSGVVQNGFGAKFSQHVYAWVGKGWQLVATERDDSISESSVTLVSSTFARRPRAKRRGRRTTCKKKGRNVPRPSVVPQSAESLARSAVLA